jgi:hypothetical protein
MEGQVNDEIGKNMGSIQASISELKDRNEQLAITHDPGNLDERITDLLTPIREQIVTLEKAYNAEDFVPGRFLPESAADTTTLTNELMDTKDYTINEFIKLTLAFFSQIFENLNEEGLQALMYKIRRRLELESYTTVKHITVYMYIRSASYTTEEMIYEHYKAFLARLDVAIEWYSYAQDWIEGDPAREFNPFFQELPTAIVTIVNLGMNIQHDIYIWSHKDNIGSVYRQIWHDDREMPFMPEFGIDQLREIWLRVQTEAQPDIFEVMRIRCFMGQLCQWTMTNSQCLYSIVMPGIDAELAFLSEWPMFITKWTNFSWAKRWYLMISAHIETKIAKRKNTDARYPFVAVDNIDYGTLLEQAGLIKLISWRQYISEAPVINDRQAWLDAKINPIQEYFGWEPLTEATSYVQNWPPPGWTVVQPGRREWG